MLSISFDFRRYDSLMQDSRGLSQVKSRDLSLENKYATEPVFWRSTNSTGCKSAERSCFKQLELTLRSQQLDFSAYFTRPAETSACNLYLIDSRRNLFTPTIILMKNRYFCPCTRVCTALVALSQMRTDGTPGFLFLNDITLVILTSARCHCNFKLHLSVAEIRFRRHNRHAGGSGLTLNLINFLSPQ